MADKRFKSKIVAETDLQVDNLLSLPSVTTDRALVINASGQVTQSTVTTVELDRVSGLTSGVQTQLDAKVNSSEKGAVNGVATLDAGGKVPSSQIPAIAITDIFTVANITARDALVIGTGTGEVQVGDVVIVTDASADVNITSGAASYIYDGTTYKLLKAGDEVISVNGNTGAVTLGSDDIAEGVTNLYYTPERAQDDVGNSLVNSTSVNFTYNDVANTITAIVDINSATVVDVINDADEILIHDTSVGALRKVTRGDLVGTPGSAGDIAETSFSMANNVTVAADVTGLAFATGTVRGFDALVTVEINATANLYEVFKLQGIQKGALFDMFVEATGDNSQVAFTITAAGQVQYTSGNVAGFSTGNIKFRALTLTV